jgi:hypothetical protein
MNAQAGSYRLVNLCPETPDRAGRFGRHTERDSASSIYADGKAGVKTPPGACHILRLRVVGDRFSAGGRLRRRYVAGYVVGYVI